MPSLILWSKTLFMLFIMLKIEFMGLGVVSFRFQVSGLLLTVFFINGKVHPSTVNNVANAKAHNPKPKAVAGQ